MASEPDPRRVYEIIRDQSPSDTVIFIGVTDPTNPVVETPEQVRDLILQAAEFIPADRLGATDDCGFSPFADDNSMSRETAFAKISARIKGAALASELLGL
ncbi:unnamed protein product [Rhizoctonia solani]|uniref:Cobalamin-independent methionine synthase MetE C-terminal/archaeal domain-containing protein n=1 Tax=Rhizoctonia solani TaxID=456999 RepID=A0A8H3H0M5_9AGAM|nr:unnamed protein product [Rhizoctonia solani]